jgi:photosystem II stability/assembly factor-like uncharacterized protein
MTEIRCKSARRWMQAPSELHPLDARMLDRHLGDCPRCTEYLRGQLERDRLIQGALGAAAGGESVRAESLARLRSVRVTPPPPGIARLAWRLVPTAATPRRLHRRAASIGAPLVAALVALAIFLPQIGPRIGSSATAVAGAPWNVVRPEIAYPMAVDPARRDHLIAGAWGKVYESWNGGDSWRPLAPLPAGLVVRALAVDSSDPRRYVVAMNHSVYISDDAGLHWHLAVGFVNGAMNMFVIQQPRLPSTWYLGPAVLWHSLNRGLTWERTAGQRIFAPYGIQALAIGPDSTLYTGIYGGGVGVSHDGGISWVRRANGLPLHVFDVAFRDDRLWAATDRGIFLSLDRGLHWRRSGPPGHFFNTSIVDAGSYQIAGGNGGMYRSGDGGKTWQVANHGLPFYSYIYNLVADPHHPNRLYACLNTDGIFRSDDAGRTWVAVDSGLPLTGREHAPRIVLFRRRGVLWITNEIGVDPGNLTVDRQVSVAVASPDGAAVAYVTGVAGGWAVRIVNAGGSLARTVAAGSGSPPSRLMWSPSSSALAIPSDGTVWTMDLHAGSTHWTVPQGERLVGWAPDGKSLDFWNSSDGRALVRNTQTGAQIQLMRGRYASNPVPAPDGMHIAFVSGSRIYTGEWGRVAAAMRATSEGCFAGAWSDDSTRFLVVCRGYVEERTTGGRLIRRSALPGNAFWAPGSRTELLFFRRGLRLWRPGQTAVLIVAQARSVQPSQ